MRHKEKKIVPEHEQEYISEITCDICREPINEVMYAVDKATVSHEYGTHYPEGKSTKIEFIDICGECFQEKVVPFLRSLGVAMQYEEIDTCV